MLSGQTPNNQLADHPEDVVCHGSVAIGIIKRDNPVLGHKTYSSNSFSRCEVTRLPPADREQKAPRSKHSLLLSTRRCLHYDP